MKLIMENWRGYLNEDLDPSNIYTLGDLMQYFKNLEPSKLQKIAGKYGAVVAKALAMGTGVAVDATTGGASGGLGTKLGAAAGMAVGGDVLEKLLTAAIFAFANIPDDSYTANDGSAASFFDIDDSISTFLRGIETKGRNFLNPSIPEKEAFEKMKEIVNQVASGIPEEEWGQKRLSDILNTTTQRILDANLLQQDRIKVEPTG